MEDQHTEKLDPQDSAAMSQAIEAWEAGDFKRARSRLTEVDPARLDPELRRVHGLIKRGLTIDPAIVLSGVVFLVMWGWVFWVVTQS